jgi:hypothetical protein
MEIRIMKSRIALLCTVAGACCALSSHALAQPSILIAAAASTSATDCRYVEVQTKLLATGAFSAVDIYNATAGTPTLAQLQMYDVVLTWSNNSYSTAATMGDVLADYVDGGGSVVVAVFANASIPLAGRWVSGGYEVIIGGSGQFSGPATLGTVHIPSHPIMNNVLSFDGGSSSFRPTSTVLAPGSLQVADWSDGRVLVAVGANPKRVDLGFYPPSSDCAAGFWVSSTDGARLMANALVFASTGGGTEPGGCCLPDGTCQILAPLACFGQGGAYRGPGTDCVAPCPQPGSCCFPSGACEIRQENSCTFAGGTWGGPASTCSPNPCPQPPTGACCTLSGCTVVWAGECAAQGGAYQGDNTSCGPTTCDIFKIEAEPNNTKLEANFFLLQPGNVIVGTSTLSTGTADPASPDYFLVQTASAPLGIYRHRLTLSNQSTPGNSSWIRGLTQTGAAAGPWPGPVGTATATESTGQLHWLDGANRINIWYGFGRQEQVYYRVSGVASTTGQYMAIFDTTPVAPSDLGTFNAGAITIDTGGQGHTNDTHVRIWDADFNPIHGYANDGASTNGGAPTNLTTTSFLRREFPAGTYYMGIAMGNLATNQGSPCDDNVRTGPMMDFADVAVDTGTQIVTDVSFSITDSAATTPFVASRGGRGEIAWFRFTVTGTIGTGA